MAALMIWHRGKHPPHKGVSWDQRTLGDLLEEYFLDAALEAKDLRARLSRDDLDPEDAQRLAQLEDVLSDDPVSLVGLSEEESEEVWATADSTGDILTDYWEYRISQDLSVDLDMSVEDVPPRDEWDEVA
jgi:hypothetical protein